jgi:hypothetical protein
MYKIYKSLACNSFVIGVNQSIVDVYVVLSFIKSGLKYIKSFLRDMHF